MILEKRAKTTAGQRTRSDREKERDPKSALIFRKKKDCEKKEQERAERDSSAFLELAARIPRGRELSKTPEIWGDGEQ